MFGINKQSRRKKMRVGNMGRSLLQGESLELVHVAIRCLAKATNGQIFLSKGKIILLL